MKDDESYQEDEIDLRKYVLLVVKRWRLIRDVIIAAVLASVLFGLLAGLHGPAYEATAGVAIIKSKTQVNFEEKIKTISPDNATGQTALAAAAQDPTTRRNTLASLVQNPVIAQNVIRNMGDRLPESLRDPDVLVRMVHGNVRKGTDVVDVTVRNGDRALLADIANTWAVAYEQYVNRVYSGSGISATIVDQDVATAKGNYEHARDALLRFNAQDRSIQLQRDIEYLKGVIGNLEKGRQAATKAILGKQADTQGVEITALYSDTLKIKQTLQDARTLRDHASKSPGGVDSSSLALLLLKAQLATAGGLPSGLQLQVAAPSSGAGGSAAQVSDLDALVNTLENRLKEIQADIDRRSAELMLGSGIMPSNVSGVVTSTSPLNAQAQKMPENGLQFWGKEGVVANVNGDKDSPLVQTLDELTNQVTQLQANLARENYTKAELTQNYNIAWQAYSTLLGKAQEVDIASQLPGSEVVFASPAVQPAKFELSSLLMQLLKILALGVATALVAGVVGVFAIEYISPEAPNLGIPWRSLGGRGWAAMPSLRRWVFRRPIAPKTEASD